MKKLHVIYVPGLGDERAFGQNIVIKLWRVFGVHGHYHPVLWSEGDFASKLEKLVAEIDNQLAQGHQVALLGFSAGASAVLNAFAVRQDAIAAVVCVSGFIQQDYRGGAHNYQQNPAFGQSLDALNVNLKTFTTQAKQHILTIYPARDRRVAHADAIIAGVAEWRTPATSHVQSIAYALTVGAFSISKYLKKQVRLSATMAHRK